MVTKGQREKHINQRKQTKDNNNGMLYLPELYDNHDRLIVSKTGFHKL
jgi:hypothetical protein